MKLIKETDVYNDRRYGKPWIAKVAFNSASKAEFSFGTWIGEAGYKGQLEIECMSGDVVAMGQKDNRNPKNSTPAYYVVKDGGELEEVSKLDAYKISQERDEANHNPLAEYSTEQLIAEIERRKKTA